MKKSKIVQGEDDSEDDSDGEQISEEMAVPHQTPIEPVSSTSTTTTIKQNLSYSNLQQDEHSIGTVDTSNTITTTVKESNHYNGTLKGSIDNTNPLKSSIDKLSSTSNLKINTSNNNVPPQQLNTSNNTIISNRIPLSLGEGKLRELNEVLRKDLTLRSYSVFSAINRELIVSTNNLTSVLDIAKSIQQNVRQFNDDILQISEKLEQTEWSLHF